MQRLLAEEPFGKREIQSMKTSGAAVLYQVTTGRLE